MASNHGSKSPAKDPPPSSFICDDQTYYQVLQLSPSASASDIKTAWRKLSAAYHPDKNETDTKSLFQLLVEAYATLKDPILRANYDEKLLDTSLSDIILDRVPARMAAPTVACRGKSVVVQWTVSKEEGSRIERFVLEFKQEGYNVQQAYEGRATKVVLTGLTDDWTFHFRVLAVNDLGAGEHSEWKTARTNFSSEVSCTNDATVRSDPICSRTQEFINNLHFAISTQNPVMIESLLEQTEFYDLHQFFDLIAFAIDNLHLQLNQNKPPHVPLFNRETHPLPPFMDREPIRFDPELQQPQQRCSSWDQEAPSQQHMLFQPTWPKSLL